MALAREARTTAPAGEARVRRWIAAQQEIAEALAGFAESSRLYTSAI